MNNTTTNNTTNNATVDLKAIQKAEKFLSENHLFGVFYLFCGEIREKGIKEKWNHEARWNAITTWADDQELNPNSEKPQNIGVALTEWYERIYLPSKWTNKPNKRYNKNFNKDDNKNNETSETEFMHIDDEETPFQ